MMATSSFALPSLKSLAKSRYKPVALVTKVDRPKGRGYKILPPPVKELALEKNIPIFQFLSLKDEEAYNTILSLNLDLIVVVAYGEIIPENILNIPKYGCINLHASLLPKYRGAAPINWTLINGEEKTGNTVLWVTPELDAGDIILQEEVEISPFDNFESLHNTLSQKGANLILKAIELIQEDKAESIPQDHSKSSYAPPFKKEDLKIDWSKPAIKVHNFVRAFSPKPGAYTFLGHKLLKILQTRPTLKKAENFPVGVVVDFEDEGFLITTNSNTKERDLLLVTRLQLENGKAMDTPSFLRGHRIDKGTILGEA
jgi:methionyl-tRNA formyltransferase